jgi:hypothetical protein
MLLRLYRILVDVCHRIHRIDASPQGLIGYNAEEINHPDISGGDLREALNQREESKHDRRNGAHIGDWTVGNHILSHLFSGHLPYHKGDHGKD